MQKELLNILTKHADNLNMNKRLLFIQFVEMAYQYTYTESYLSKYRNAEQAFNDFFCMYLKSVCDKPFTDILGELMTDIDLLDNGKNTKLCQHLTPQHLSNAISEMMNSYIKPNPTFERIKYEGFSLQQPVKPMNHFKIINISKMLNDIKFLKIKFCGDICVGTGVLILDQFKQHLKSIEKGNYPLPIYFHLNDKDSLMCKICAIQLHFNNLFNNKIIPIQYRITNHDAITEYQHFKHKNLKSVEMLYSKVKDGIYLRSRFHLMEEDKKRVVIGSDNLGEITDDNIKTGLEELILKKLAMLGDKGTYHSRNEETVCQQA